jgi:galactokinase
VREAHPPDAPRRRAWSPGRVNLLGDHTDYTGGRVLPIAIDLGTLAELDVGLRPGEASGRIDAVSDAEDEPAHIAAAELTASGIPRLRPRWARYVAATASLLPRCLDGRLRLRSSLPEGAGLSSSAALVVASALALGFGGAPLDLARLAQAAEQLAVGVPCGIMDPLAAALGEEGHALLVDCHTLAVDPVPLPADVEVLAVHSGRARALASSAYATRRAECAAVEERIGPLRSASLDDLAGVRDPLLRRRARHVVTENARVLAAAAALREHRLDDLGQLLAESHRSLAEDFEVSTPELDDLVADLRARPGVLGCRLTGAGFGGCVVVLAEPGALDVEALPRAAWRLRASGPARLLGELDEDPLSFAGARRAPVRRPTPRS